MLLCDIVSPLSRTGPVPLMCSVYILLTRNLFLQYIYSKVIEEWEVKEM